MKKAGWAHFSVSLPENLPPQIRAVFTCLESSSRHRRSRFVLTRINKQLSGRFLRLLLLAGASWRPTTVFSSWLLELFLQLCINLQLFSYFSSAFLSSRTTRVSPFFPPVYCPLVLVSIMMYFGSTAERLWLFSLSVCPCWLSWNLIKGWAQEEEVEGKKKQISAISLRQKVRQGLYFTFAAVELMLALTPWLLLRTRF